MSTKVGWASVSTILPPGRTARAISEMAAVGSCRWVRARAQMAKSKAPSSTGRSVRSPTLRSAPGARSRATSSMASEASMPVVACPAAASQAVCRPVPQAASRARPTGRSAVAACTRGSSARMRALGMAS